MKLGHGIRVESGDLIVKTSPGWSSFRQISTDWYQHQRFSFGGAKNWGEVNAAYVADLLLDDKPLVNPIPILNELGWSDVIRHYRAKKSNGSANQAGGA
jgi:hypothetical protein